MHSDSICQTFPHWLTDWVPIHFLHSVPLFVYFCSSIFSTFLLYPNFILSLFLERKKSNRQPTWFSPNELRRKASRLAGASGGGRFQTELLTARADVPPCSYWVSLHKYRSNEQPFMYNIIKVCLTMKIRPRKNLSTFL